MILSGYLAVVVIVVSYVFKLHMIFAKNHKSHL